MLYSLILLSFVLFISVNGLNVLKLKNRSSPIMYSTTLFNQWTVENVRDLSQGLVTETERLVFRIKDKETRNSDVARFLLQYSILGRELLNNALEQPMGQKGEWWFALQVGAIAAVIYGTVPLLGLALKLTGLMSVACGLYYVGFGLFDMSESISPFVLPVSKNILKTQGAYGLVRHPIYSGLILLSFGCALITGSLKRFVLSIGLAALLVRAIALRHPSLLSHRYAL